MSFVNILFTEKIAVLVARTVAKSGWCYRNCDCRFSYFFCFVLWLLLPSQVLLFGKYDFALGSLLHFLYASCMLNIAFVPSFLLMAYSIKCSTQAPFPHLLQSLLLPLLLAILMRVISVVLRSSSWPNPNKLSRSSYDIYLFCRDEKMAYVVRCKRHNSLTWLLYEKGLVCKM
jgi:hypothetical protein